MKTHWKLNALLKFCAIGILGGLSVLSNSYAHDGESRVELENETVNPSPAGDIDISFEMIDTKTKKVVTDSDADLNVMHEKKLHMFIFDPSLIEFRHVHPTFDGAHWNVKLNQKDKTDLKVNGNYWIWAQGQLKDGNEEFATYMQLKVINGLPEHPMPPLLGDLRVGTDGRSQVRLSGEAFKAGVEIMPMLTFSRTDGSQPVIAPFLGAKAHVVGVLSDGDSLIHVHPMDMGPTQLMLHMTFKEAGEYRLWVQFIDRNELKTIPLSVVVTE